MPFNDTKPAADLLEPAPEKRVKHQRNRMAGLWAAELLGLLGTAARDYAHDVAHAHDHDHDDDEKVVERLSSDLHGKAERPEIREKLRHFLAEARRQLKGGPKV